MFKEKSSKKKLNIDNRDTSTLDAMHNKMIKKFDNTNKEKENHKVNLLNYERINNNILNQIEYLENFERQGHDKFIMV